MQHNKPQKSKTLSTLKVVVLGVILASGLTFNSDPAFASVPGNTAICYTNHENGGQYAILMGAELYKQDEACKQVPGFLHGGFCRNTDDKLWIDDICESGTYTYTASVWENPPTFESWMESQNVNYSGEIVCITPEESTDANSPTVAMWNFNGCSTRITRVTL